LFPSPALPLEEITVDPSGCLDRPQRRIVVPNGGECEFTILPSEAAVRSLKLQLVSGGHVNIETTAEPVAGTEMDIDSDLPGHGSSQTTLTFFKSDKAQTMTIDECSSASGCVLNVLE
jgi:hypothetical protein